jgi:hypothetical protein
MQKIAARAAAGATPATCVRNPYTAAATRANALPDCR